MTRSFDPQTRRFTRTCGGNRTLWWNFLFFPLVDKVEHTSADKRKSVSLFVLLKGRGRYQKRADKSSDIHLARLAKKEAASSLFYLCGLVLKGNWTESSQQKRSICVTQMVTLPCCASKGGRTTSISSQRNRHIASSELNRG